MNSPKHTIKINNSYESEPSSGSGSSVSEHNDFPVSDDENMHLPYLLKPPSYETEITITTTDAIPTPIKSSQTSNAASTNKFAFNEQRQSCYGGVTSSQESSFEGFTDSPFGKMQRQLLKEAATKTILTTAEPIIQIKNSFCKFYDTVMEENSCNAVDMQLSEEVVTQRRTFSGCSSASHDGNPSSELSFNGRIKSLTSYKSDELPLTTSSGLLLQRLPTLLETSLNSSQLTESFILKKYSNEKSPDLFGDDDDDDDDDDNDCTKAEMDTTCVVADTSHQSYQLDSSVNKSLNCPTESSFAEDQTFDCATQMGDDSQTLLRNNCRRDKELLRRIRKCLDGVPPPPSMTIPQLDMFSAVLERKEEILNFHNQPSCSGSTSSVSSLYRPTHTMEETKVLPWKDILGVRQHGLYFNLTNASESNEYLSLAVIERFIGAETASSYRNSPSSAKKRNTRLKLLTQSPGNRLSHLAKRRAVFSSANLATTSQKSSNLLGPQVLFDKKKIKNRRKGTPKRKTPGSKKKARKTPSSSARKRLFRCDLIKPGPSRETSKRALFQSPAKQLDQKYAFAPKLLIKPEIANRVEKSKRALFSPDKNSQSSNSSFAQQPNEVSQASSSRFGARIPSFRLESLLKRKRDPADDDEEDSAESSKLFRGSAENLTPRALKIKSQSFCIGAGSSAASTVSAHTANGAASASSRHLLGMSTSQLRSSSSSLLGGKMMQRAHSDMSAQAHNLTENQRKKLLWAVSQALQEKKISTKHESFKQFASVLARVVRRVFQEYYQRGSTSNSETMLRLSKKYVYNVISGKNADDIYFQAKAEIDKSKRQSSSRLSGYIGPEEYEQRKNSQLLSQSQSQLGSQPRLGSMQNLFAPENSIDSFGMSISQTASSAFGGGALASGVSVMSQCSLLERVVVSQESYAMKSATKQQPIQPNPVLQNSSSKNNLCGLALRENVDCEQRRSAQKNFTGKDQRNVSPYAVLAGTSSASTSSARLGSGLKVQQPPMLFSELNASGAKAKRQISFES